MYSMPFVADHMGYVDGPSAFVEASLSVRRCHVVLQTPVNALSMKWMLGIHVAFSEYVTRSIDLAIS